MAGSDAAAAVKLSGNGRASTQEDPNLAVPDSYDDVTAAYARGDLTREEYDLLSEAVLEAGKAEDQAER